MTPRGWSDVALGDVADVQAGDGFPPELQGRTDGDFPFFKVGDISEAVQRGQARLTASRNYVSKDDVHQRRFHVMPVGTVVFAKIGAAIALNRRGIAEVPLIVDNNVMGVLPKPSIVPRFLYWYMRTVKLEALSQATTVPSVRKSDVEQLPVPLPPLDEQRRIVAKLDKIFAQTRAARTRLEQVPALVDKLKRSILAAACAGRFTSDPSADDIPSSWRWATVQDLVVPGGIFDGARDHGSGTAVAQNLRTADYTDSGVRVIRLENLAHLAFIEDKRTFISEEKFTGLKQSEVREGDLLFGSFIDEQVRVCRLPRLSVPAIAKADCFCVRPDPERVLPEYLLLQLACQRTRDSIETQAHGLGRLRITTKQLRTIGVPLCSMSEQRQIVDKVTAQFALAAQIVRAAQSGIERTEAMEKAALAKAFRGELVEQDPSDEPASAVLDRIRQIASSERDKPEKAERKTRAPRSKKSSRGAADSDSQQ